MKSSKWYMTRTVGVCALLSLLFLAASCGGGDKSSGSTVGPVSTIALSPTSASIQAGQTQSFFPLVKDASGSSITNAALTWTSSATGVATVDGNGVATGVAPGSTTITAKSSNDITSNSVTLNVTTRVTTVIISPMSTTVAVGSTRQFTATALDAQGNAVTNVTFSWFCSFSGTATIDNTGLATGVAPGTVTIVASVGNTSSQPATLTVTP